MENYEWINSLPALLLLAYLGMFCHFLQKQVKGETLIEIKDYFKNHFKSTLLAFMATTVGVIGYYFAIPTGKINDPIAAFGIGMTFDSILNKWDKP